MSSFTAKVSVHTDIKDVSSFSCPIFSLLSCCFLGQSHILLIPALMHERFTLVPQEWDSIPSRGDCPPHEGGVPPPSSAQVGSFHFASRFMAKKKICYVALTRPKFENWVGRSGFFFFFFYVP